jgi:hypothetical protein
VICIKLELTQFSVPLILTELNPAVYALQKGDDSNGGVVVNVQMRKVLSIKIGDVPEVKAEITPPKEPEVVIDPEPTGETEPTGTQFVTETEDKLEKKGGGCLIATAAYGSELAPQIQQLRELRDNQLLQTQSGTSFMNSFNQFYYSFSPTVADWERENPAFKEAVKIIITPMISTLSVMTLADGNSEAEVLGLGLSVIALNIGMYFVAPGVVIHTIRKKL